MRYRDDAVGHRSSQKTAPKGNVAATQPDDDDEMDVDVDPPAEQTALDEEPGTDGELNEPQSEPEDEDSDTDESEEDEGDDEGDGEDDENAVLGGTDEDILDAAGYDEL